MNSRRGIGMSLLSLSRKTGERVRITLGAGVYAWVTASEIEKHKVRLCFDFPREIIIEREEVISDRPRLPAIVTPAEPAADASGKAVRPWPTI
jgi:sRNA-binding carbon storage regulator CsrA